MKETLCWNVILATSELCTDVCLFSLPLPSHRSAFIASASSFLSSCHYNIGSLLSAGWGWKTREEVFWVNCHVVLWTYRRSPAGFLLILLFDSFLRWQLLRTGFSVDGQVQVLHYLIIWICCIYKRLLNIFLQMDRWMGKQREQSRHRLGLLLVSCSGRLGAVVRRPDS